MANSSFAFDLVEWRGGGEGGLRGKETSQEAVFMLHLFLLEREKTRARYWDEVPGIGRRKFFVKSLE